MLKHYLHVALRNLRRNKAFSAINIFGLALGMACSLFIYLWVQDERSYDNFHRQEDRLYRVMAHSKDKDGTISGSSDSTPGLLAEALEKEVPEVAQAATITWNRSIFFTVGARVGRETGCYAGPDFFKLFSFPLLQGDSRTALTAPDNILISQKLAQNYFGKANPIGQTIRVDNKKDFLVNGVFSVPQNSSVRFDFVLPIQNFINENPWVMEKWSNFGPGTYVLLRPGTSVEQANAKIRNFLGQHDKTLLDNVLTLQPFRDIYLYNQFTNGIASGGRVEYMQLFSVVAIFILLLACINFMNLATARSVKRAKEVGVRKVIGAVKELLVGQFIGEALLMTLLATGVAVLLVYVLLPVFNQLTEKQLILPFTNLSFLISLLGFTLITGLLAGSYPALFLSSLNPITVLKGTLKFKPSAVLFRKGLVAFQFAISMVLLVSTAFVYRQMHYIQTKNLGLNRENVIFVPLVGDLAKNYPAFRNQILSSGNVAAVTKASMTPTRVNMGTGSVDWPGKAPDEDAFFWELFVGYDFMKTLNIQLVAGREFSPDFGTDSTNVLINEEAAKAMRLKNPVGETVTLHGKKGKIIGVMQNFHLRSFHEAISPLIIGFESQFPYGQAVIKSRAGRTKEALATLEKASKAFNPAFPFDYTFADEDFNQQYQSEQLIGRLANIFAALAIVISCLGLFGLALFTAEQRTKEIGIRKVLGASVTNIVAMLSKDFLQLVVVATLMAFPVAYWAIHQWFQAFVYHVPISWWVFALAGTATLLLALLTISFQAVKAAMANPVKSLHNE